MHEYWKQRSYLYSCADNIIAYIENSKISNRQILKPILKFNKISKYKTNIKNVIQMLERKNWKIKC